MRGRGRSWRSSSTSQPGPGHRHARVRARRATSTLALQDVQTQASRRPSGACRATSTRRSITKTNPEDQPIMWLAALRHRAAQELADFVAHTAQGPASRPCPGVGEVRLGGYLRAQPARLARRATDGRRAASRPTDVLAAIRRQHVELPAGRIETADRGDQRARARARRSTSRSSGPGRRRARRASPIRLGTWRWSRTASRTARRIARNNGKPAQGMGIRKQRGANAVEIATRVHASARRDPQHACPRA